MTNVLTYWMALAHAERLYTRRKNEIVVQCFTRGTTLADFFNAPGEWTTTYGITDEERPLLEAAKERLPNYSFIVEDLLEQGFQIIPITSPYYPTALKKNLKYNAPVLIYTKGNTELLQKRCVAVVGSRGAQPVSLHFTRNVAAQAAQKKEVVVSGFAQGVDREALQTVLAQGGESIIVLPQGIKTFSSGYTTLHKAISTGKVVVVSTYQPQAPWSVALAMARNTIIYAFAMDIYVAESDSKGGTYSGVVDGLRKNRTIFVRQKEENEHCANDLLIEMGAKAVDLQGNEIEQGPRKDYEALLRDFLTGHAHTAKEIAQALYEKDDRQTQSRAKRLLTTLSDIETLRKTPLKYIIRGKEPTLFD